MKMETFYPQSEECEMLAKSIFEKSSGISKNGKKYDKMRDAAQRMRDAIEDKIEIRVGYRYIEDVAIRGKCAVIEGYSLECNAFEQIDPEAVEGAYVYALSAGDFSLPEDPIMDQLYADIWGTAFTDAARLLLKKELEKKERLSDSFGPGFYGMNVNQMDIMGKLLNFEDIELELRNGTIILPLKSCAGIYFTVNDKYMRLKNECSSCFGTRTSCKLCQIYGGNE